MSAYSAIFNNFIVNDLHIDAQQLGAIESFREIPGFLTVVLAAVTVRFRVSRLAAGSLPPYPPARAGPSVGLAASAPSALWLAWVWCLAWWPC